MMSDELGELSAAGAVIVGSSYALLLLAGTAHL